MARIAKPWWWEDRGGWYATVRGVRHRLAGGRKGLPEARRALARLIAHPEADDRTGGPPGATIAGLGRAYLEECAARVGAGTLSDATRVQMRIAVRPFCLAHGRKPAMSLTPELVAAWVDRPGWGRTTRVSVARRLRTLARWAHRRGLVERDPLAGLVCGTPGRREVKVSTADARKWIEAIVGEHFRAYATFLLETGCRRGEASAIEARHIDFERGVVTLDRHKGERFGRPRRIILTPAAAALAREWAMKFPGGAIFRNTQGGAWNKPNEYRKARQASERSGIKMTLHALRHQFATRYLQGGTPVAVVAALLGHASPSMTLNVYNHVIENVAALRDAVTSLKE
jgi:integrase